MNLILLFVLAPIAISIVAIIAFYVILGIGSIVLMAQKLPHAPKVSPAIPTETVHRIKFRK